MVQNMESKKLMEVCKGTEMENLVTAIEEAKDLEIAKLRSLLRDKEDLMEEYGDKITQREDELDLHNTYVDALKENKESLESRVTSLLSEKERFAHDLKLSRERFRREQAEHDRLILHLERENIMAAKARRETEEELAKEKERVKAQQLHIQALELRLGITVSFAHLLLASRHTIY